MCVHYIHTWLGRSGTEEGGARKGGGETIKEKKIHKPYGGLTLDFLELIRLFKDTEKNDKHFGKFLKAFQ